MRTNRWRRWLHRTVRACRPTPVGRGRCEIRFTPRLDLLEDRVVPASYSVTTPTDFAILADNSDVNFATGQITDHGNAVSLRSAIIASNHTAGPNTIALPAGTYLITRGPADDELNHNGAVEQTGDFDVFANSLTVTGTGSGTTVIDGNSVDRVFDVQSPYGAPVPSGVTFNLSGVTLQNGHAPADGSLNENGGAIAFNGAGPPGQSAGQLILNDVVLKNNTAEGSGGGLYAQSVGAMTLTNVTFDGNTANHGGGGAITYAGGASDGNVQVQGAAFTNNKALDPALGSGGAIQVGQAPGGSFVVQYSSFSGNQAGTNGGALSDENAGTTSSLSLKESTVAGNSAKGNGGGVFINDTAGGTATLASATVTNNRANTAGGAGVGGGIDQAAGGVTLVNTIVAGNFKGATGSTADDARGTLATSSSYNLFGTGGSANLTSGNSSHNLFNVASPGLGALGNYGGPTLTVPLLAGSPALDAGINPDASNADQRNGGSFLRVVDLPSVPNAADGTDIGAFESRGFSLSLVGSDSESTKVTTQFPNPLRVAVTARDTNVPVNGAWVLFTGPVTTTGATIYPNPTGATVSSGIASATVYANFMSSPTSYTVLASLVGGVNTVPFHLRNDAAQAELAVTNVGPTAPVAGTDVTFTITVKNNGPDDAQNVKLADTLPGSTTAFTSQTQTSGPAFTLSNSGNVISDTIATLAANATAVFSVVAHVPASVANNTLLNDTATVTTDTPDPNLSNNGSTASSTISTSADVAVTLTGPANALAGTNVTYTIGVTTNGPSDAQSAVFGDTLPAGETFVSLTQASGPAFTLSVGGSTFGGILNTLAAGASASFTAVARVNANVAANTVLNDAARDSSSTTDPNNGNNSAAAATTVGTSADVVVSNVGPATAIAGDPANVTYAIAVTNAGPSDAQGVALADALPNGMTFVSQAQTSGPGFTLTNSGNSISDTITTLPGAASEVQTITVTGTSGTITLSFNGQSTGPLPYNATYGVIQGALSSLSTIGGVGGSVNVAQSGNVYTVGFQGGMTATAEPLLGAAGAGGAGATVAELTHGGPGAPATFTLVAHVSPTVANNTVLNDTATVSAGTSDPNLANNSSTVATRINPLSNLAVTGAAAHLTGQGAVDGLILTFNESIQAGTFTTTAVDGLTGPGGAVTPTGVTQLSPTQFEVTFAPQTTPGTYTLVVGPYVTDLAGNPMDQNGDGIGGENPADRYTTTFGLPLPATLPFQENFDDGAAHAFISQSGSWSVVGGHYGATPTSAVGDAVSLLQVSGASPANLEFDVLMSAAASAGSYYSNGFIVFDYQSATNFKYAGAFVGLQQWVIGHRDASGWHNDAAVSDPSITPGTDSSLQLLLQGANATLLVNGASKVAFTYASGFTGPVGLATDNSVTQFDNLTVQQYSGTLPIVENFDDGVAHYFSPQSGSWSVSGGRYDSAPVGGGDAVSTLRVNGALPNSLEFDVLMSAAASAGGSYSNGFIVFDYRGPTSFKYAGAFVGLQQWVIGHRDASGWHNDTAAGDGGITPGTDYSLQLLLQGANVALLVNGASKVNYGYAAGFSGSVGLGTENSLTQFDNLTVQRYNPPGGGNLPIAENFDDGVAHYFSPQSGSWAVSAGRYDAAPSSVGADAVSNLLINGGPPNSLEFDVLMSAAASAGGYYSNGFIVFDYQSPTNFKFAGAYVGLQQWVIGHRDANGWEVDAMLGDPSIAAATDYNLQLLLQGNSASLLVNGAAKVSHAYAAAFSGSVGLGTQNSLTQFDNLNVQQV